MIRRDIVAAFGLIVLPTAVQGQASVVPEPGPATSASADAGLRFGRIRLSTGVELEVAQSGPADGRPVLFLHGYTDSWFSYSPILGGLPPDIHAIVPSQRGHGNSERPQCCYLLADFASDAIALLDALGVARADVVGHSMGSFIAQRIAIDHPDRVGRLVLIGSGSTVATPAVIEFAETVRALDDTVAPSFVREFQAGTSHRPLPPAFLDGVVRESSGVPGRVWRAAMAGMLAGDARDELGRIQAATLIVWGEHDGLFDQADQDALLRAIPRARLVTYRGVAHSPNWEEPERFLRDLTDFLGAAEDPRSG